MATAVIIIGGAPPSAGVVAALPAGCFVIAADSGYDHARSLGLAVDLIVGDLDSISDEGLADATMRAVPIERHRADKDATDTELALDAAVARGASSIVIVTGGGDRVDHLLATLFLVASDRYAAQRVVLWWSDTSIAVLHGGQELDVPAPSHGLFSILPVHGSATGVDIVGARFPLDHADIAAGSSLGISNVADDTGAGQTVVRLGAGTLLVISPHALEATR